MAKKNPYAYDRNYYENLAKVSFEGNAARKLYAEEDFADEEFYDDTDYAEDAYYDEADYAEEDYAEEESYSDTYDNRELEDDELDAETYIDRDESPATRIFYNIRVNLFAVMIFATVICALVFSAFRMLEVKSDITQTERQLKSAKNELAGIRAINDSLRSNLDTEVDRNYIYSVAVGKLGMQYPDKNQIIEYKPVNVGYVRQMSLIP